MTTSFDVKTATIPQSGQVSNFVSLINGKLQGIWSPILDSETNIHLIASYDQRSENFVRLVDPDLDSGGNNYNTQWNWLTLGSEGIIFSNPIAVFPYIKLESDLIQDQARHMIVLVDFRP